MSPILEGNGHRSFDQRSLRLCRDRDINDTTRTPEASKKINFPRQHRERSSSTAHYAASLSAMPIPADRLGCEVTRWPPKISKPAKTSSQQRCNETQQRLL